MPYREIIYDRETLYREVWTEPVIKVATRYGISDVALAKTCRKLCVPLPPRGYWARLAAGQAPRIPKLEKFQGESRIVTRMWEDPPILAAERETVLQVIQSPAVNLTQLVPASLEKLHPLADRARKRLLKSKAPGNSLLHPGAGYLHISVSHSSIDRAALLFDSLLRACDLLGYTLEFGEGNKNSETVLRIHGENIRISLVEKTTRMEHVVTAQEEWRMAREPWASTPAWDYFPNGNLAFFIKERYGSYVRHRIGDTQSLKLEFRLKELIELLQQTAANWIAERNDRKRKAEEAEVRRQRREALNALREAEQQRIAQLITDARHWREAQNIREYVAALMAVQQGGEGAHCAPYATPEWIRWALEQADRIDPQRPSPPSILDPQLGED